jgi:3-isopropylmalate/(R)-2-methylmalate dehydratase small subunit
VRLPAEAVSALQDAVDADPECVVTVDLAAREVRAGRPGGEPPALVTAFEIDDYTRWRLMEGLDDISLTMQHADEITSFERGRAQWLPTAVQVG